MAFGTWFIVPGFLIVRFLIPKNAPIKTSGEELQSHSNKRETIVKNGTAADEFSAHRKKFIKRKTVKAILG